MHLIMKLLLAQYRCHWIRTLLTLAALTTSVAMVVVVVGGYDLAFARAGAARQKASEALGRFDMIVLAGPADSQTGGMRSGIRPPAPPIGPDIRNWLRRQGDVKERFECGQMQVESRPAGVMYRYAMYRPGEMITGPLYSTTNTTPPYSLAKGQWLSGIKDEDTVVADEAIIRRLRANVGDTFQVAAPSGRYDVRIGGILKTPTAIYGMSGIYVSPTLFKRLAGEPMGINSIRIALNDSDDKDAFIEQLSLLANHTNHPIHVVTAEDFQEQAERFAGFTDRRRRSGGFFPMLRNAEMNLAILAAMFIIFNTLSMGLQERTRQLAMLRAIGMTRRQMIVLIATEIFLLALIGWLTGVTFGWLAMRQSIERFTGLSGQDVILHLGLWFGLGALTSFGATLLAAAVPAYLAARRRPLEGMSGVARPPTYWSQWLTLLALPLIALNPLAAMTAVFPEPWRTRVFLPISGLTAVIGFALLLPMVLRLCERPFAYIAGLLFGLDRRLLAKQLSANLGRTVSCAAAMMLGLGLYVTIQIWGQSMMTPFLVTTKSPDAIATVFPNGVPADKVPIIAHLPGVTACIGMILEHPELANLPTDVNVGGIFSRTMIYLGGDARTMIGKKDGMLAASFVRGRAEDAYVLLDRGGHCLITASLYLRAPRHYDVGKTLALSTAQSPQRRLKYTIAGVIDVPGWHLLTKSAHMRPGLGRVGGIVIVPSFEAKRAYPNANTKVFWLNLAPDPGISAMEPSIIKIVDPNAKPVPQTPSPRSRPTGPGRRRGRISDEQQGRGIPGEGRGLARPLATNTTEWDSHVYYSHVYCRVTDIHAMTAAIRRRSVGIIQALTFYPLLALGLASLAVVNTMMIATRSRSWETGILRSLGLTRWQLLRMVLAEGVLIGLLACVGSMLFGLLVSYSGIAATSHAMGVIAPYIIPWGKLFLGLGAAIGLCLIAGIWPAILTACRRPLQLLQDGRTMD